MILLEAVGFIIGLPLENEVDLHFWQGKMFIEDWMLAFGMMPKSFDSFWVFWLFDFTDIIKDEDFDFWFERREDFGLLTRSSNKELG